MIAQRHDLLPLFIQRFCSSRWTAVAYAFHFGKPGQSRCECTQLSKLPLLLSRIPHHELGTLHNLAEVWLLPIAA